MDCLARTALLTESTFSVVQTEWGRPSGFFFIKDPSNCRNSSEYHVLIWNCTAMFDIRLWMEKTLTCDHKIIVSKNCSSANTRCSMLLRSVGIETALFELYAYGCPKSIPLLFATTSGLKTCISSASPSI